MTKVLNWTSEQKEIFGEFENGKSHFRVVARAGTGKTSTIEQGLKVAPENLISYLVFNKKLQLEAAGKITNPSVDIRTLHSLGFSFILKNWRKVKANKATEYFRIKDLQPDMPSQVMFRTAQLVSYAKNTVIAPTIDDLIKIADMRGIDAGKEAAAWPVAMLAQTAFKSIEKSKEYSFNISFDDMVFLPVAMGWVKPQFDLVVVDECQDMNLPQLTMATQACRPGGRVCLVGDDRQAIYGFRGAMTNGMEVFKEKLNTKDFPLTITYRCPKKVVAYAQQIVPDIKANEAAIDGEVNIINQDKMMGIIKVKDCILSRTNAPLMKTCLSLIRKNIPAYIEGRDIGKDLITLIENIGGNTINEFLDNLIIWQGVQAAKASGTYAASKIDLVNDKVSTLQALSEACLSIDDMIKKINSLFMDSEFVKVPSVVLSTVHKAKGLEWPHTYLLSDTFKSGRRQMTAQEQREEENIYYVALTRAKNTLNFVS